MAVKHYKSSMDVGKAGEHLVCFDLLANGYDAFLSDQGLPYDVVADIDGNLKRIQVKTTATRVDYREGVHSWRFNTSGTRSYADEADIIALVVLDDMAVCYMDAAEVQGSITVRTHEVTYRFEPDSALYMEDLTLDKLIGGTV